MRNIIATITVSLDGFIEGSKGELNWFTFEDAAYNNHFFSRFDTFFYGRIAYEKLVIPRSGHELLSDEEREFRNMVCNTRKYVFSHKEKHLPGNGMMINDNIEAEVRNIKSQEGKDICLWGGAEIIKRFMELDLIDEYIIMVQPVILGSGKSLFKAGNKRLLLKLMHIQNLQSGVVILHYKPERMDAK